MGNVHETSKRQQQRIAKPIFLDGVISRDFNELMNYDQNNIQLFMFVYGLQKIRYDELICTDIKI